MCPFFFGPLKLDLTASSILLPHTALTIEMYSHSMYLCIIIGNYYDKDGSGYCLIINNEDFSQSGLPIRQGTSIDSLGIKKVLEDRNVTVREVSNCTALQIHNSLSDLSSINGTVYQFLIVFILSHGYYGRVCGVDGIRISTNDVQEMLCAANLPEFKNKAKILILHTCQEDEIEEYNDSHFFMIEKHFLVAFPTLPHRLAYRHLEKGTFYIQCLIKVIEEKGETEDITSILTIVNRELQGALEAVRPGYTQTSVFQSTLTDKIYLRRRNPHLILRELNDDLHSGSYCFISSFGGASNRATAIIPIHRTNHYQQSSRGGSQAHSVLDSVKEESLKEKFKTQQTLERLNSENENEAKNASSTETTEQHHTENRHDATLEQFPLAVPAASENEFARQSLEDCKTLPSNLSEDTAESINEQSQTQRDEQVPGTSSNAVTKTVNQIPSKSLNEEFVSDEERIDREELSPTLLWDDMEVEIETKETNEEEECATLTTPSIVCSVTMEGWVNVHTSNNDQPATIKEEEIETGFIMATLVPVRERELQEEWLELY
ncbi:PREDICTED: uncharacterized protein LOC105313518 isoform X1 [Amphimedon queenslandica]|uniref:Caspase family p20 domain-containing protein n=1 Tax=Amphimedon queenslandica TaxID=400682 RepID=A0AAN0JD76_AMPQE|nr:PREDICTED: uncharacterized protein LOC105313518 isoform X1 [Amphimedon queenslandica]|eukprot:XP_019854668.1 PREDICTED: uncharacterized protein LOC105313518 isoform X1 [Amphimedon queenslandica]